MIKLLLPTALFLLLLISFANAQDKKKTYLETNDIKGNVKSISRSYYDVVGSKKELDYTTFLTFDKTGNLLSESSVNAKEPSSDKTIYTYDNRNNQLSSTEYVQDTIINSAQEMKYNEKNILVESSVKSSSYNSKSFFTYVFDAKGNILEKKEKSVEIDFEMNTKTTYSYDEKGNTLEENYFNSGGNLKFSHQFKYDEKGKTIEWKTVEEDGTVSKRITYQYDENGKGIQEVYYGKYGNVLETIKYSYDSYDAKVNWTIKRKMVNGIEVQKIERQIIYY